MISDTGFVKTTWNNNATKSLQRSTGLAMNNDTTEKYLTLISNLPGTLHVFNTSLVIFFF